MTDRFLLSVYHGTVRMECSERLSKVLAMAAQMLTSLSKMQLDTCNQFKVENHVSHIQP